MTDDCDTHQLLNEFEWSWTAYHGDWTVHIIQSPVGGYAPWTLAAKGDTQHKMASQATRLDVAYAAMLVDLKEKGHSCTKSCSDLTEDKRRG